MDVLQIPAENGEESKRMAARDQVLGHAQNKNELYDVIVQFMLCNGTWMCLVKVEYLEKRKH